MTNPIHDEAALRRSVRVLITVADNVRRGTLPNRALHRIVSPQVANDIVAELGTNTNTGMSEVATIHLQQPDPTITYFTGSARRPDNTAVAYLGVFGRDTDEDAWHVTQVLPVNERTIGEKMRRDIGGAPLPKLEAFRDLITLGYLDPAIRLLGPIPTPQGQRHDWLDAATAIRDHGETHQLGPLVADDLQTHPSDPPDSWTVARQITDAYTTTYGIDPSHYATWRTRMESMRDPDRSVDPSPDRGIQP